MTRAKEERGRRSRAGALVLLLLAALLSFAWWAYTYNLKLVDAWSGFSPVAYVYESFEPQSFARNFPGGVEALDASAFMHLYKIGYAELNLRPELLQPVMIGVEILILALAVAAFVRFLEPESSSLFLLLVVTLVVASWARNMDLARFAQPFFAGQYYNVANALRLLAILAALRGRVVWAAGLLALSFLCHPTMALMGGVFIVAVWMAAPRDRRPGVVRLLGAGLLFAAVAGAWVLLSVQPSALTGGSIPPQWWFALTRLGNFHWYPVNFGVFTTHNEEELVPFLSFCLLLMFYLARRPELRAVDRQVVAGFVAMGALVVAGVAFSVWCPSPLLVKLALHRANDLIVLVGLVYVARGLWREIEEGPPWRTAVALAILASPFLASPGFPLLLSLALVSPSWARVFRARVRAATGDRGDWWVTGASVLVVVLMVVYWATGLAGPWRSGAYTGLAPLLESSWRGYLVLGVAAVSVLLWRLSPRWIPSLSLALLLALAGGFLYHARPLTRPGFDVLARDYLEAQRWAETETPRDALFMPPPSHFYGWRDFSHRSSFGSLREWLHNAWMYNSRGDLFREGMRRFAELGIPLDKYLEYERGISGFVDLAAAVRARYHGFEADWFRRMAGKYGIDYFVLFRKVRKKPLDLPIAFSNGTFLIVGPMRETRPAPSPHTTAPRSDVGSGGRLAVSSQEAGR